ncbi:MAG: hypothetical protein GYA23_08675 [Methanomicrobiales archaeon]|nr:hypothetical protein [Methanomicrobiales archaeon]
MSKNAFAFTTTFTAGSARHLCIMLVEERFRVLLLIRLAFRETHQIETYKECQK